MIRGACSQQSRDLKVEHDLVTKQWQQPVPKSLTISPQAKTTELKYRDAWCFGLEVGGQ